jgi:hypothetical protein
MAHIASAERLHGARQAVGIARRHQQVDMVGHQDIGVHRAATFGGGRREPVAIAGVVVIGEENRGAIVAALDDVQRQIG